MRSTINKKGVSPLIATVLLIAFAVALGAVVMNWSKTQFDDGSNSAIGPCSTIDFGIEEIEGSPNLCYSNQEIFALVHNNGENKILKFKITVLSSTGDPHNSEVLIPVPSYETKKIDFKIPADFGTIQKIKIIPVTLSDSEDPSEESTEEVCSSQLIEIIHPGKC